MLRGVGGACASCAVCAIKMCRVVPDAATGGLVHALAEMSCCNLLPFQAVSRHKDDSDSDSRSKSLFSHTNPTRSKVGWPGGTELLRSSRRLPRLKTGSVMTRATVLQSYQDQAIEIPRCQTHHLFLRPFLSYHSFFLSPRIPPSYRRPNGGDHQTVNALNNEPQ